MRNLATSFQIWAPGHLGPSSDVARGTYSTMEEAEEALRYPSTPVGMQIVEIDGAGRPIRYLGVKHSTPVPRVDECAANGPHVFRLYANGVAIVGRWFETVEEAAAVNANEHGSNLDIVEADSLGRPVKRFSREEATQFIVKRETVLEALARRIAMLEKSRASRGRATE